MTSPTVSLLLVLALTVSPSVQLCSPDCAGVDPGTKVRDPTDCTRYYVCIDASGSGELVPSNDPVECPDGQYFNPHHTLPRCDPIDNAPSDFCENLCNPCKPHCNHPGEVTPDPVDCGMYYVCLDGGHVLEVSCPTDMPYFDFLAGECGGDMTLCYHYCDQCLPHCTAQQERVLDPKDCHKFYLCTPPTMSSFLCPHNEVFNPDTQTCEAGAVCDVACGDTLN